MEKEQGLDGSERELSHFQRLARLGYYTFDFNSGKWTSSEVLDELFGIDKTYNRDLDGWINIIHPDHREELSSYLLNHVLKGGNQWSEPLK